MVKCRQIVKAKLAAAFTWLDSINSNRENTSALDGWCEYTNVTAQSHSCLFALLIVDYLKAVCDKGENGEYIEVVIASLRYSNCLYQ